MTVKENHLSFTVCGRLGLASLFDVNSLGSLQGRDVGQSGFECGLALFGAPADAFSAYERGVADADEPEETRQECFLMIHKGHRRRGGVEPTAGRGDDQLLTARETLHAGRSVFERLAGRGKAINPGL